MKMLGLIFSTKNSLTWEVKCENKTYHFLFGAVKGMALTRQTQLLSISCSRSNFAAFYPDVA